MSILTESDRNSDTWKRIREHYEGQLQKARNQNDNDQDPVQTARLRGRIAEIKLLLALDKPPKEFAGA